MAAEIIDITTYSPRSSDIFFFDNNIWMHLYCPIGNFNRTKQRHYSSFLQSIQTSRSTIFINSMVLSEFVNRYLRLDYDLWRQSEKIIDPNFKSDYVGTDKYKETVNEIKSSINQIMRVCEKASDDFNSINLDLVLGHLSHIDFNDSYYLEIANQNQWKLVTDDGDFISYKNHNVKIVTIPN